MTYDPPKGDPPKVHSQVPNINFYSKYIHTWTRTEDVRPLSNGFNDTYVCYFVYDYIMLATVAPRCTPKYISLYIPIYPWQPIPKTPTHPPESDDIEGSIGRRPTSMTWDMDQTRAYGDAPKCLYCTKRSSIS